MMTDFDLPSTPTNDLQKAQPLAYPLSLSFKLIALSNKFELIDARGQCIAFVRQPWAKIKEHVTIYSDSSQNRVLYTITANRIIDWGASYNIETPRREHLGQLKRKALKSFFKAYYELHINNQMAFSLSESNPWTKVFNNFFEAIPLIGGLSGYVFHPRYALVDTHGTPLLEIRKVGSFFGRSFEIHKTHPSMHPHEMTTVLACLMAILLEHERG